MRRRATSTWMTTSEQIALCSRPRFHPSDCVRALAAPTVTLAGAAQSILTAQTASGPRVGAGGPSFLSLKHLRVEVVFHVFGANADGTPDPEKRKSASLFEADDRLPADAQALLNFGNRE